MQKSAQNASSTYSFSSQPKAVAANRKKFREPGDEPDATGVYRDLKETCITWDKRVHRGNTYSLYTQNAIKEALAEAVGGGTEAPRRKRRVPEKSPFDMPLPQKESVAVDLTKYLVAKEEEIVVETVEAQTDEFLPEPPPEQYQPQKTGKDVATQVEEFELFDFEYEVEPILDVLINKTLEQSLMEVEEEEELARMQEFKEKWYKEQEKTMKDWDAQVAEEWVRWNAKEKVLAERRELKKREARVLLKIQAMAQASAHLKSVVPNAVGDLQEVAFPDMKGMDINRDFLPNLFAKAQKQAQSMVNVTKQVDKVIANVVRAQVEKQHAGFAVHRERNRLLRKKRFAEVQIRHGRIRIKTEGKVVGPIDVSSQDTIDQVQNNILEWLKANEAALALEYQHGVILCIDGAPIEAGQEMQIFNSRPPGEKQGQISMRAAEPPPAEPLEGDGEGEGEGEGDPM